MDTTPTLIDKEEAAAIAALTKDAAPKKRRRKKEGAALQELMDAGFKDAPQPFIGSMATPEGFGGAPEEEEPEVKKRDPWVLDHHELHGRVEVTEVERDLYLKAALHDTTIIWPIIVPGTSSLVKVRSLTQFEEEAIERAAVRDKGEDEWMTGNTVGARMEGYFVCARVTEIAGKSIKPVSFDMEHPPSLDEAADDIRRAYIGVHQKTHAPRYQVMLAAVRLFDVKMLMCARAMSNSSFY